MRVNAKAIHSKPPVSLFVATGSLDLRADDLTEAAIITAIYRAFVSKSPDLRKAITKEAKKVADEWQKRPEFTMKTRRRKQDA